MANEVHSIMQTIEQERSRKAWECVQKAKQHSQSAANYANWTKKVSSMIVHNGLGQTLAFLVAKSPKKPHEQNEYRLIYNHLQEWLCLGKNPDYSYQGPYRDPETPVAGENSDTHAREAKLLYRITKGSSDTYRLATVEALAFLSWLSRLAEAFLEESRDAAPSERTSSEATDTDLSAE